MIKPQTSNVAKYIKFYIYDDGKIIVPTYKIGDFVYVRERYFENNDCTIEYESLSETTKDKKWTAASKMNREKARLWLRVTDVYAQRLKHISEEELMKSGYKNSRSFAYQWNKRITAVEQEYICSLRVKKYGYGTNPWVWVIEFDVVEKPDENDLAIQTRKTYEYPKKKRAPKKTKLD